MTRIASVLPALLLAACGQSANEQVEAKASPEPKPSVYEAAVLNSARLQADFARDAGRKPAEVLEFLGVAPGMTVLDMFSGGGYYTEIISHVVGAEGKVVAQSNAAYLNFVGDEFADRYLGGRLPNTEVLMAENNELSLAPGAFDAIMMVLSFHDLFYAAPDQGWPAIDVTALLAELHKGLKDDGFIGIVDHVAAEGSPSDTGNTLHRIDPAIVVETMAAAGFELDGQADMLRNPDDTLEISVFDPSVRGNTDRFVLRFRKAGATD